MSTLVSKIIAFQQNYLFWLHIPHVTITDIIEIAIIAYLFYHVIVWVKSTRAWALFKGLLIILIFVLIAAVFQMNEILWLAGKILNFGVIAVIVVFQPELRRALESLGKKKFLVSFLQLDFLRTTEKRFSDRTVQDTVSACYDMGAVKTGALIVIEQNLQLAEVVRTGIELDGVLSYQLLLNIFEHNTPLHDGAIVVRGDRIVAATCYLPLSDNMELSKELGTRHRAAVGMSEVSDALIIVVSEETGAVSTAYHGVISRDITPKQLKEKIISLEFVKEEDNKKGRFRKKKSDASIPEDNNESEESEEAMK